MQSFEDFYAESKDLCFRAIYTSVKSSEEAHELLSAAYERALARWTEFQKHPNPHAWIVTTALNIRKDEWKHRWNVKSLLFTLPLATEPTTFGIDRDLVKAIRKLPEQQKQVLVYRVLLDLSVEETAKTLDLAPSTVSVHLSRALSALRAYLKAGENYVE